MDIEIVSKTQNPLLHRTEVKFLVHHIGTKTPARKEAAELVKNAVNAGSKVIVVDDLDSEFGRAVTRGYAKVYDTKEHALAIEPEHLLIRNGLKTKEA